MPLVYAQIEEQLAEALPELRPAAERYWRAEGLPGADCGPSIFIEEMFATYLEIRLALDFSPARENLLRRAFAFVGDMLLSDDREVADLAAVSIFESRVPWWWARAKRYFPASALAKLDRVEPDWRLYTTSSEQPTVQEKRDIIDRYDVRSVIASEVTADGLCRTRFPP